MGAITTQEMIAIQRMMGAEMGGLDPFPIGKTRQLTPEQEQVLRTQEIQIPNELQQNPLDSDDHISDDIDASNADDSNIDLK
jgi:uncharacterized protein involved in high-affinity Fe2+ transport